MGRGVSDKITYKPYNQGGQWLLPPSLDELVPQNHFVRIVSKTVDELEIEEAFARNTKGGGDTTETTVRRVMRRFGITAVFSGKNLSKACKYHKKYPYLLMFLSKFLSITTSKSAWTEKTGLWTTSELSVFGEVSSTRTSTLNAMRQ